MKRGGPGVKSLAFSPSKWCILMHSGARFRPTRPNCHYDVHDISRGHFFHFQRGGGRRKAPLNTPLAESHNSCVIVVFCCKMPHMLYITGTKSRLSVIQERRVALNATNAFAAWAPSRTPLTTLPQTPSAGEGHPLVCVVTNSA